LWGEQLKGKTDRCPRRGPEEEGPGVGGRGKKILRTGSARYRDGEKMRETFGHLFKKCDGQKRFGRRFRGQNLTNGEERALERAGMVEKRDWGNTLSWSKGSLGKKKNGETEIKNSNYIQMKKENKNTVKSGWARKQVTKWGRESVGSTKTGNGKINSALRPWRTGSRK